MKGIIMVAANNTEKRVVEHKTTRKRSWVKQVFIRRLEYQHTCAGRDDHFIKAPRKIMSVADSQTTYLQAWNTISTMPLWKQYDTIGWLI